MQNTLNITSGNDIALRLNLYRGRDSFPTELSSMVEVNLVSRTGRRTPLEYEGGFAGTLLVEVGSEMMKPGIYGIEVRGVLNGAVWRTYADGVLTVTYATEKGASDAVSTDGDAYDVQMEVQMWKGQQQDDGADPTAYTVQTFRDSLRIAFSDAMAADSTVAVKDYGVSGDEGEEEAYVSLDKDALGKAVVGHVQTIGHAPYKNGTFIEGIGTVVMDSICLYTRRNVSRHKKKVKDEDGTLLYTYTRKTKRGWRCNGSAMLREILNEKGNGPFGLGLASVCGIVLVKGLTENENRDEDKVRRRHEFSMVELVGGEDGALRAVITKPSTTRFTCAIGRRVMVRDLSGKTRFYDGPLVIGRMVLAKCYNGKGEGKAENYALRAFFRQTT